MTAGWFAIMARQAGRNWTLWGFSGGAVGLVVSTIVFGLAQAGFIPMSDAQQTRFHIGAVVVALALTGILGWVLTMHLHRQHQVLFNAMMGRPASTPPPPADPKRPAQPALQAKQPGS